MFENDPWMTMSWTDWIPDPSPSGKSKKSVDGDDDEGEHGEDDNEIDSHSEHFKAIKDMLDSKAVGWLMGESRDEEGDGSGNGDDDGDADKTPESGGGADKELESGGGADKELESGAGVDKTPESGDGADKMPESGGGADKTHESGGDPDMMLTMVILMALTVFPEVTWMMIHQKQKVCNMDLTDAASHLYLLMVLKFQVVLVAR
eukprot:2075725-Karenia_brevis.AAC.1